MEIISKKIDELNGVIILRYFEIFSLDFNESSQIRFRISLLKLILLYLKFNFNF